MFCLLTSFVVFHPFSYVFCSRLLVYTVCQRLLVQCRKSELLMMSSLKLETCRVKDD